MVVIDHRQAKFIQNRDSCVILQMICNMQYLFGINKLGFLCYAQVVNFALVTNNMKQARPSEGHRNWDSCALSHVQTYVVFNKIFNVKLLTSIIRDK